MSRCAVCGVDEEALSIPDATVAIRTFPRRYRDVLADVPEDLLRARPDPRTWSMLEYVVHTREVLELLAGTLPIVLSGSAPVFPPIDVDDVAATRPDWVLDVGLALDGIRAACASMATEIDHAPPAAWDRAFRVGEVDHTARWIPRHAAHEGAHHLRDIELVRDALSR